MGIKKKHGHFHFLKKMDFFNEDPNLLTLGEGFSKTKFSGICSFFYVALCISLLYLLGSQYFLGKMNSQTTNIYGYVHDYSTTGSFEDMDAFPVVSFKSLIMDYDARKERVMSDDSYAVLDTRVNYQKYFVAFTLYEGYRFNQTTRTNALVGEAQSMVPCREIMDQTDMLGDSLAVVTYESEARLSRRWGFFAFEWREQNGVTTEEDIIIVSAIWNSLYDTEYVTLETKYPGLKE